MGRRPYLNSLALGRSPYEAPELIVNGSAIPQPNRHLANSNADGYVQEYDARGHPINRRSKAEARQLRKAKNDVLSTMGIVVSGEELNTASMREQEKIALLAEENDFGLALAAIDQLSMFGASWWTKSLACRIQTFKSYNISSLTVPTLRLSLYLDKAHTIGLYCISLATSPFILLNLYINVRPVVEARVYRILRRRLPKPDRPDKLSLRVAVENELIEWTAPSLGKRSEEEIKRSHFTLAQEIKYELVTFKNWLLRSVGFHPTAKPKPAPREAAWLQRYESVQRRVGQLQQDLRSGTLNPENNTDLPTAGAGQESQASHTNNVNMIGQILENDENRFAQSPIQLPEGYFSDIRTSLPSTDNVTALSIPSQHDIPLHAVDSTAVTTHVPASRTNTLFSPSPSPESSPPSSPRVRASLIHQNSDVITMHLELLQSHTDTEVESQGLNASVSLPNGVVHRTESQTSAIDRAASELLDALLSDSSQHPGNVPASTRERGHSIPNEPVQNGIDPTAHTPEDELDALWQTPGMNHTTPNPPQDNISSSSSEQMANGTGPQRQPLLDRPGLHAAEEWDHHVTILSSHPADAFSSHLSSIITSVLFYPFESLYLRSLAFTYFSTQSSAIILPLGATASLLGLQSNVRPLGAWMGGGNALDMLSYVGKMALIVGFETVISAGIWGLGASAAVTLGKIKFQWGQL
ncbi:hypothetical protein A7C99_3374 [Trichophyton rubrum]|uniref:Uncharacterized protein n=1 Tax=Trichophyton rubrum TaxID=5551 RepID=A0A178F2M3_TRIRU|nr:hypothetical protein A7C99_3374 [Trichophyton rubrum]